MLAKVFVGLLALAAVAVGGYYYYDAVNNPTGVVDPSNDKPCCGQSDVAVPACCSNPGREAIISGACCEGESTGTETLSIAPRTVEAETAPQPREANAQ